MKSKFKIGDIVCTIPGWSDKGELFAGAGYKEGLKLTVLAVYEINSKRGGFLYTFKEIPKRIYEYALIDIVEMRENKLNIILK